MDGTAIILTDGLLDTPNAKTAHGLLRGTNRYNILGVIDAKHAGVDAGKFTDNKHLGVPIFKDIGNAKESLGEIDYCIVGVATLGGLLSDTLLQGVKQALEMGMNIVNGMHQYLSDIHEIASLAKQKNKSLTDIRKPKPIQELHFWDGKIKRVTCPIVAILGTDCALGKRTTAQLLAYQLQKDGFAAEMIYTGQTGWLQGWDYGFIFDSTLNDFVSGELAHAVVSCYENKNPDVIILEGQSALMNPSGPCGSEYIISAGAKYVILQHAPKRKYFEGWEKEKYEIPPLSTYKKLISAYGATIIGLSLNDHGLSKKEKEYFLTYCQKELDIPASFPLDDSSSLINALKGIIT